MWESKMKKQLEERYLGKTIVIVSMLGEPNYTGKTGTVKSVDDSGQLHGTWGGLAIQIENDKFAVIG
jgi:hypothetical protein